MFRRRGRGRLRLRFRAAPLVVTVALAVDPSSARAVDPFEIQVYDGAVADPGRLGLEVHVNSVISGVREAEPPELPAHHQSHFTLEPAIGITRWWEAGMYLQSTLLPDGSLDFAGVKLRTKFALPARADSPFRFAVNMELSRLPERYDRDRWGGEVRPIATWSPRAVPVYVSVNPIVDLSLAGGDAPAFEPAATVCYVIEGLMSFGLEYYADFGPIGSWAPAGQQQHYLYEVINVLRWKHVEVNIGAGEGLTDASNGFVGKMIVGYQQ